MNFKTKKILAWTGLVVLVLIGVVLAVRAVFNFTNGKRLEKTLDRMRAAGIPLTLKEVEPECPPKQNAAIPWKSAEALLSVDEDISPRFNKIIGAIYAGKSLREEDKGLLRDLIAQNQEALHFLRQASRKPCYKYVEDWEGPGLEIKISNAVKVIRGIRLLGIDALLKAEEGQVEQAIEQCLDGKRFSQLYLQEPFLISYLISTACVKQIAVCMQEIVRSREIDTEILQTIIREWDPFPWRSGMVRAFESERVLGLELGFLFMQGKGDVGLEAGNKFSKWLLRPILKSEAIWLMGCYDLILKAAELPYYATPHYFQILRKRIDSTPKYFKITKNVFPNAFAVFLKRATLEAIMDTARIGMACQIYKNRYGEYPDELDQLAPDILEQVPADPFTGESMIYKRKDSGFMVYSVGSNRKDDEGRVTWEFGSLVMEKDDDWTWKVASKQ